jgi:hypothetical protein
MERLLVSLTPAQVAGIDSTALEIMGSSGTVVIPRLLQVYRAAGGAFTVGAGARLEVIDEETYPNVLFSIPADGLLDQTTAQSRVSLPILEKQTVVNSGLKIRATGSLAVVAGAAATSVLGYTNGTNPAAAEYLTIGGMTYTIIATVIATGQVKKGASADATFSNLAAAINGSDLGCASNLYWVTAPNPYVTAAASAGGDTLTFTARSDQLGTAGNSWTYTFTLAGASITSTFATNATGVDATASNLKIAIEYEKYPLEW